MNEGISLKHGTKYWTSTIAIILFVNLWRLPQLAIQYRGNIIYLYLFALITIGLPLSLYESKLGSKRNASVSEIFGKNNTKFELVGWWQNHIALYFGFFSAVIGAWGLSYLALSPSLGWGETPYLHFLDTLNLTTNPLDIEMIHLDMVPPLLIIWILSFAAIALKTKVLSRVTRIINPLLLGILLLCFTYALSTPNAEQSLREFFTIEWGMLLNGRLWVSAYGHVFLTLGICYGLHIFILRGSDENNFKKECINIVILNGIISITVASITFIMFNTLDHSNLIFVGNRIQGDAGFLFVVFSQMMNSVPLGNNILAVLFYISLSIVGLNYLVHTLNSYVVALHEKFEIPFFKVLTITSILGTLLSLLFVTNSGIYFLDISNHYLVVYGLVFVGMIEVVFMNSTTIYNKYFVQEDVLKNVNHRLGWGRILLSISCIILIISFISNIYCDITNYYQGYSKYVLLIFGLGLAQSPLTDTLFMIRKKGSEGYQKRLLKNYERL